MNSYRQLCAEFYDLDKPTAPEAGLAFYRQYAQHANGPILEPMCGSGRFLIPLLAEGFEIEGVDASPPMLAACRHRNPAVTVWEQRLEELTLPRRYALVIIPAGSFCLLTELPVIRESLRRLRDVLLPDGTLVMEVEQLSAPAPEPRAWDGREVVRPDGARIRVRGSCRYDAARQVATHRQVYELVRDGQVVMTEDEELRIRYYAPPEMQSLLTEAGFHNVKCFAGESPETFVVECLR